MDKDLEFLKRQWREIDTDVSSRVEPHSIDCEYARIPSLPCNKSRLERYYKVFMIICCAYVLLGPLSLWPLGMPVWLLAVLSLYFGVMAALSSSVRSALVDIDFGRMSVKEALAGVDKVLRRRRLYQWVGYAMAVPLLFAMLCNFYSLDRVVFLGGVAGAVLGGVIGMIADMKMRRMLGEIRNTLTDILNGE